LATGKIVDMKREVQRYLSSVPRERKPLIDKLHTLIVDLYPEAEIDMSYRMPTYKMLSELTE